MGIDEHARTVTAETGERQKALVVGDRYEILGLLGSGGMGNVYRARDLELDEVVALKVLRPEIIGVSGAVERFRREVRLARRVTHPNVARVFDIGEHGGDRILTMELVEGESLAARIEREGPLALEAAMEIARAICAGVAAAHEAGVVHRDLKPENVLLATDGRVVVTDFGIARAVDEGRHTVGVIGTPAYMAPEQIDERTEIDHRADIYALGGVLYEMLTGELAWPGQSLWAMAAARLLEPPPDARAKRPELPDRLAELVLRCMARDPEQRPASLTEVAERLAEVALPTGMPAPIPSAARPPTALVTGRSEKRVAVLPFANIGPAEQAYVADGVTEDLIDALSAARGLRVRSRGMVMPFAGSGGDPRDIGRELDVTVVMEGSVRPAPGGYRINARLVSVLDGFQLWGRRVEVAEADLLAEVDAIAQAAADALSAELETTARPAGDPRAVDLYLRARDAYHRSFSGDRAAPVRLYRELLALTPDDPRALAGLALATGMQFFGDADTRQAADDAAERAIALAPSLPDAHHALGFLRVMVDGNTVGAIRPTLDALRLSPTHVEARHVLGRILLSAGRVDEAIEHLTAARRLEPAFELPYLELMCAHVYRDEVDRADELIEEARARDLGVHFVLESRVALWTRDAARARRLRDSLDPTSPTQALSISTLDLVSEGVPPVRRGVPPTPPGTTHAHVSLSYFLQTEVEIACVLGEVDAALTGLERFVEEGGDDHSWMQWCPVLEPLRQDPRSRPFRDRIAERAAAISATYDAR